MSDPLTPAEQAEAFRIRMLIGPVKGRDDSIIEWMASEIEQGHWSFRPSTSIIEMEGGRSRTILPSGAFRPL
jgi:hypothetical protein